VSKGELGASAIPRSIDALVYAVSADDRTLAAYERAFRSGLENTLSTPFAGSARRTILISSTSVFAQKGGEWVDEDSRAEPDHDSARVLLDAERAVIAGARSGVAVRASGIYGPPRAGLVERVRAGTAQYVPGHVTNRIFVSDLARATLAVLDAEKPATLYVATDDEPTEQREVLEWLARRLGAPPPRAAERLEGRAARSSKRCRNARLRSLGWQPEFPTFREGYAHALAAGVD
jgi:dTDP-4-dehydrorhamnose reductase